MRAQRAKRLRRGGRKIRALSTGVWLLLICLLLEVAAVAVHAQTGPGGQLQEWTTTISRSSQVQTSTAESSALLPRPPRSLTAGDSKAAQSASEAGRAALQKHDYVRAAEKFGLVLKYPENAYSRDAEEYLGFALQRLGRTEDARGAYSDYILRYPEGEGAQRVRQRLDVLITAAVPDPKSSFAGGANAPRQPENATWTISGGAAQRYIRTKNLEFAQRAQIHDNGAFAAG